MVLISDEASISASNAVAQLGPEDTKGAFGLGKRLDVIAAWLNTNIGPDWRSHSHLEKGEHTARYMFRSEDDAAEFETAIKSDRI